jgi:hypothetical protein
MFYLYHLNLLFKIPFKLLSYFQPDPSKQLLFWEYPLVFVYAFCVYKCIEVGLNVGFNLLSGDKND